MNALRRISLTATAGLLGIAVMLGWVSARPSMSAGSASRMATATAYFDSTIVLARNSVPVGKGGDALAIALGYLERERIGTSSPFRLVDAALHDPRLDSAMANRVAWALLGRLRRGDAYVIDPSAFEGSGPWSADGLGATGTSHLALIEETIANASDPRAGELAVRLAYSIAAGKGTTSTTAATVATEAAALVRDRALAQEDLRDLLSDAAVRHEDAMQILVARRAARGFRVEQPSLAPLASALRVDAMDAVPELLGRIDTLERATAIARVASSAPVLNPAFASRLGVVGERQPEVAQINVTLRAYPHAGLAASNEETLISALAAARARPDSVRRDAALATLASAVAMRSFAQASPWFVGMPGPEASDLVAEFSLRGVDFTRAVPEAWRPFYLRELQSGLRDMTHVFPALSLDGLNVAIGAGDLPDSALAMHDPRTRTLKLTIGTSSGTLAHEIAHDLDWQTARRIFATGGGYSTDRAVHERRGTLATSVRGLAEARLLRPVPANDTQLPDRPAELYARSADWFVATTLSLDGRMNGFLTAVQDAALPGYAAGAPTTIGTAGSASLLAAIDQMTFVSDSVLGAFENTWANPTTIDPLLMVRRVFATPVGRVVVSPHVGLLTLPSPRPVICSIDESAEARARSRLLATAIEARARGIARRRAHYHMGARPDWANGLLQLPPYDTQLAEPVVASIAFALANQLRASVADYGVVAELPASFRSSDASCSAILR
jgi:hypothetical protein